MSRSKNVIINPFDNDREDDRQHSRKSRKRRRWPYVFFMLFVLACFLPNLLGLTGLHQRAIDYALADFQGTVSIERVSLGWLQAVRLTNVSAVDPDGNELFKIEQITTSKSLLSLMGMKDFGQIEIHKPLIFLHLRPDGSNLEDAFASYLVPQGNPLTPGEPVPAQPSFFPKLTVQVTDGRALVTSSTDPQTWQLDGVHALIQTLAESAPLAVEAECRVMPLHVDTDGQIKLQQPGQLMINAQIDPESTNVRFGSLDLLLATTDLPVSITGPLLQRFVGPAQAAGLMSGNLQSRINLDKQSMNVEIGNLQVTGFGFSAPQVLGADIVQLQNLTANGTLEVSPQVVSSSNFQVESDFGRVNANGRFDVNELAGMAAGGALVGTPFQMEGQIDLAGMVRMLPSTLQLHRDLQIQSGTIQFQAATSSENGVPRLVMNLDAANLKARRGNQNIVWQNPLRLVGTITQSAVGLELEDLLCESDFLDIAGSANLQTAAFRTQGDLSKLMQRVGQFVDLNGTQLAGKIDGSFGWQTAGPPTGGTLSGQPIQIGGSFVVENPVVQFPDMPVWQQPRLSFKLSASGQSIAAQPSSPQVLRLDQGGMQIEVGSERAVATLAAPLQNAFVGPWNLNCQLTGGLNGWLRHIQNFVDLGAIQVDGQAKLTCAAALNNNFLQLSNVEYEVEQLAFDGYGTKIREPKVTGTATAVYDLNTGQLAVADTQLTANSIVARGQNLRISYLENLQIDGPVAFRCDVNRIADWYGLSPSEDSVFWFGNAEGNLQLASNENGIGGRLNSTITDLVAAQRATPSRSAPGIVPVGNQTDWQELFREPKTELSSDLMLANDFNSIQFANLLVNSSSLRVTGTGSVADLAATMLTDISGLWNPDWQKINALLGAYTGNLVQLSGSDEQPFSIRGPLFVATNAANQPAPWISPALQATTSIRWDRGSVLNVPVGASQFDINLQNSFAMIKTSGIPFSGGVVKFAPSIDMRSENPVLLIDQDRIVDNLTLSPETARQWLKFVAPLAADATSAQGRVTIDAQTVRVPVFDPASVEARGEIHLADVVIGAGPLADQLINTVTQVRAILKPGTDADGRDLKTWLQMSQQTIPIAIQNQRVFHENVSFTHKDMTVKTRGSVGFDQSLTLIAEIPIADDWIAGKSYLAGLRGQSLSIPIGGTVSQPRLDKRAVQQLSTQLVKQAAGNAINQAIGDKITPKVNEYQNQFNNKINNELNKFQGQIGDKLGGSLFPQGSAPPPANNGTAPANGTSQPDLGKQLEGELLKGIGNLFGGGN